MFIGNRDARSQKILVADFENRAVMRFDDAFDNGQPQPHALGLASIEWRKDALAILLAQSRPTVDEFDLNNVAIPGGFGHFTGGIGAQKRCAYRELPTVGLEVDRIFD